jgi:ElaB/YqjD/DUF883 family membrane-anchored ribosome-binding protein
MTSTTFNDSKTNYSKIPESSPESVVKSAIDAGKDQAGHLMDDAKHLVEKGKQAANEKIKEAESAVMKQSDILLDYIKAQPVKSVLIALGAGFVLNLMTRK